MKRRTFIKAGVGATLALPQNILAKNAKRDPMRRIAMSTVTFRFRFKQTNPRGEGDLLLTQVPEYYRDRFKLKNVEFWSKHFESRVPAYLDELKAKLAKAKAKLINIQVDESYNLAAEDPDKRASSITFCKDWLDTAAYLGAPSMRVNSGQGDKAACIQSLKELNAHAKGKGLVLLVENHGGLSADPDQLLSLIDSVGDPNIKILADYANWPSGTDMYAALKKVYPKTHLISAKTKEFNADHEHTSFDFDKCTRLAEESGFEGIYSAEQWSAENNPADFERASDWMIGRLRDTLA